MASRDPAAPDHLIVGTVGKPHGLEGESYVLVRSDDPDRFRVGSRLLLSDDHRPLVIRSFRQHRDRFFVAFEGVRDRSGAEALRGRDLLVPVSETRDLGDGEYWDHELVGCTVTTPEGGALGEVTAVDDTPAQELLVVRTPVGERYVPFVGAFVREVDVAAKQIVIEPVPGLLD